MTERETQYQKLWSTTGTDLVGRRTGEHRRRQEVEVEVSLREEGPDIITEWVVKMVSVLG